MIEKERKNNNLIYQPFDRAFKVIIDFCPKLAFDYLNLPGNYVKRHDKEFIGVTGTKYQLDSLFQSICKNEDIFEDLIINLEHQSSHVSWDKLKNINMYSVLASYFFAHPTVSIVLTDVDSYDKSMKEYRIEDDIVHKPRYIYFSIDEINEKIKNLNEKHDLNETLSDMESMDLAFLPIMVPEHMRKEIVEKLANLFKDLKIENEIIVAIISQVLNLMIHYFFEGDKLIELKGRIKMGFEESEEKLLDARINEFNELNDKLHLSQEETKKANKERDDALSETKKANKERDDALSETKKANKERDDALSKTNHFIEALQKFKKQGKISDKDLISLGIIL